MRYALAVVVFGSVISTLPAQDGSQSPVWSGSYSADLRSKYLGNIVSGVFADRPVLQEELDLTRQFGGTSLTGIVWNSTGFVACKTFACETDLGLNATRQIGSFVASGTVMILFINPTAGFDVRQIDVKVSRPIAWGKNSLTPFIEAVNLSLTRPEPNHGSTYPMAGASYIRKLSGRFSLGETFRENYDIRGGFGKKSKTSLFYAETALRFAVTESAGITARLAYGGSYTDPGRPPVVVPGIGIAKTF